MDLNWAFPDKGDGNWKLTFCIWKLKKEKTLAVKTLFYLILETDRQFQEADISRERKRLLYYFCKFVYIKTYLIT